MAIALATKLFSSNSHSAVASRGSMRAERMRPDYLRPVPAASSANVVDAELRRVGVVISCRRGKMLVEEGGTADYVFKVESGALRAVRLLPDGRRYITSFLMAGDFFGLTDAAEYSDSIEAVSDAQVVQYPRRSIDAMFERDARVGRQFFNVMSKELTAAQDRLVLLGRKTALERLAVFLLVMADRKSDDVDSERTKVDLPMNRSDIADYLGLRIETISRILTALRKQKVIALPDAHSFVLLDREALEEMSEGEV